MTTTGTAQVAAEVVARPFPKPKARKKKKTAPKKVANRTATPRPPAKRRARRIAG